MLNILGRIYPKRKVCCAYQDIMDCKTEVAIDGLLDCHFLSGFKVSLQRKKGKCSAFEAASPGCLNFYFPSHCCSSACAIVNI